MNGQWPVRVLLAAAVFGCAERNTPASSDGRLMLVGSLDFGRVPVHSARELEVRLRNAGRGVVRVEELWTAASDASFQARLLDPTRAELVSGEEAVVRVRFHPRQSGTRVGALKVRSDSTYEQMFEAKLHGEGVDAFARVLTESVDFGRIEAGAGKTLWVELENSSDFPVKVEPELLGADKDELELTGNFSIASGARVALSMRFSPTRVGKKHLGLAIAPCAGCIDTFVPITAEALEQAVVAEPPMIEFGQVPIDREALEVLTLHNLSTEPMEVLGASFDLSSDASFKLSAVMPVTLGPDDRLPVEVRYAPGHMGLATAKALFAVSSRRHPNTEVELSAFGGASELCVAPEERDFGTQPVGSRTVGSLIIKNCGASNAPPLDVTEVSLGPSPLGGADQFNLGPLALPITLLAGQQVAVKVFFEPTQAGLWGAVGSVRGGGGGRALVKVPLQGTAQVHAPCEVRLTPGAVDFGTVPPSRGAVLGIKVENIGADLCAVKHVRLVDDAGGAFFLPGGVLEGLLLPPANAFTFQVAFRPGTPGAYRGMVRLEPADPANPVREVPLSGNAEDSCLTAIPSYLDFGLTRPDCPAAPLRTNLSNVCTVPLGVRGVFIGAGTTDGEFLLTSAPVVPLTLMPGDSVSVQVTYLAAVPGMNLSPLYVDVAGLSAPYLVPLLGESSANATQTDSFVQQDGSKVDVLFVLDNTSSMVEEQPRLRSALPAFASAALARKVDLHVGVTTTGISSVSNACPGGADGGEAGRLFPADGSSPRVLTHTTPNLGAALQVNADVGQCAVVEQGLEAMRRAFTPPLVNSDDDPRTVLLNDGNRGFLRDEAALAVVFVGDEDDHSPDDVDTYVRFLQALKGAQQPGRATVYAIAPDGASCATAGGSGTRYAEAAQRTGGEVLSICALDYEPLLKSVAQKAFSPQQRFPLSDVPDAATLQVSIDGVPVTGWSFDGAANQIVFAVQPSPGARIDVSYRRACP
ncbi:MAG: choice-of-anchor D domain-containing protein [Myxococcota bacterium]